MTLSPATRIGYTPYVAAPSVTGRDNPMTQSAPALLQGAFFVRCSPSMVNDAGQSARAGRVPWSRFVTPVSFAAPSVTRSSANSKSTRSPRHV